MKLLTFIITWIGTISVMYSQPTLLWSEDFQAGITYHFSDLPEIQEKSDTIKVIGRKNTPGGQRLLIVKYDLSGDTISTRSYGSDSVLNNTIIDYKFDTANNVYILNQEKLGFFKSKIVLQKYSLDGNLIWVSQIKDPGDTSYMPHSLALVNDTNIFITAYKEYDYPEPGDDVIGTISISYLYSFNSNGNLLWQREFNPTTEVNWYLHDIFIYNNEAFLFSYNYSFNVNLIKVDLNNNIILNSNTGISGGISDIQLTPDSKLLIIAMSGYRISKLNLSGSLIWTRQFATNLPSNVCCDVIEAAIQDSVGNIYLTGRHYGYNYGTPSFTNGDILTQKYDHVGNLVWQNRYAYNVDNGDAGNTIQLKNGQVYVGGESQRLGVASDYDYVILKIDSATGLSTGEYRYNGLSNGDDVVSSLFVINNDSIALTGLSYMNGYYDWTTQLLSGLFLSINDISSKSNILVFPNPVEGSGSLTIFGEGLKSYSIVSTLGKIVQQGLLKQGEGNTFLLDNFASGVYLLHLNTNEETVNRKIVVR